MSTSKPSETAKAVVRRNTEEVQGKGNIDVFEQLFADDFVDHTPQPNMTPDKPDARVLYKALRAAFPDFHAVIPLADRRRRGRDDLQDLSWDAPGNIFGGGANRPEDPLRSCGRHAGAQREDHRALGCGQPILPDAAARRFATGDTNLTCTEHQILNKGAQRGPS